MNFPPRAKNGYQPASGAGKKENNSGEQHKKPFLLYPQAWSGKKMDFNRQWSAGIRRPTD